MNYNQAVTIAALNTPELIVMPPFGDQPELFAVKKSKDGAPFSISLPISINKELSPEDQAF